MKGKLAWICYNDAVEYPCVRIEFEEPSRYLYDRVVQIVYFEVE